MNDQAAEKDARCSCGPHAIVFGEVPDPGCPIHGARGVNAWSTCAACGRKFRHAVGHACVIPPAKTEETQP